MTSCSSAGWGTYEQRYICCCFCSVMSKWICVFSKVLTGTVYNKDGEIRLDLTSWWRKNNSSNLNLVCEVNYCWMLAESDRLYALVISWEITIHLSDIYLWPWKGMSGNCTVQIDWVHSSARLQHSAHSQINTCIVEVHCLLFVFCMGQSSTATRPVFFCGCEKRDLPTNSANHVTRRGLNLGIVASHKPSVMCNHTHIHIIRAFHIADGNDPLL